MQDSIEIQETDKNNSSPIPNHKINILKKLDKKLISL